MQFQRISPALSALSALLLSQVQAIDISYQSHIKPSAVALDAIRHKGRNAPSTKADEKHIHEEKVEKSFGFNVHKEDNPIRKNVGVSLGYTETTTDTNTNIKTHNNQTLSANNITLSSGGQTALESVDTKSENPSLPAITSKITF